MNSTKISYSKYKFTDDFFYKKATMAVVESFSGYFDIRIMPTHNYSGRYILHTILRYDNHQSVFRVIKVTFDEDPDDVELNHINAHNEFFIGIGNNKMSIYKKDLSGIILKL